MTTIRATSSPAWHVRVREVLRTAAKQAILSVCGVQRRLPTSDGLLLTFDDGPDPEVTPRVLDLLAEHHAKAVFFIVGSRIPRAPHMLQRILDEGHAIGNHTYDHPLNGVPRFVDYYRDVQRCQVALQSHTGQRPVLFRPPLGSLTIGSLFAPRMVGLKTMLWSVDVGDWKLRNEECAIHAGQELSQIAGSGDIALLHDDNPFTISVLRAALPMIRQREFNLGVAIDKL